MLQNTTLPTASFPAFTSTPLPQLSLLSLGTTFRLWLSAIAGPRRPYWQHRSTRSLQGALTNKFRNIEPSTTATSTTAQGSCWAKPAFECPPVPIIHRQRMNDGAGFDVDPTRCVNASRRDAYLLFEFTYGSASSLSSKAVVLRAPPRPAGRLWHRATPPRTPQSNTRSSPIHKIYEKDLRIVSTCITSSLLLDGAVNMLRECCWVHNERPSENDFEDSEVEEGPFEKIGEVQVQDCPFRGLWRRMGGPACDWHEVWLSCRS